MSECNNHNINNDYELAKVIKVDAKYIYVERVIEGSCKNCAMHGLCGSKKSPELRFVNDNRFETGEEVLLKISTNSRIVSSLVIFILPAFLMIAFYYLAKSFLNYTEEMSIAISFGSLIVSFILIFIIDRIFSKSNRVTINKKTD